MPMLEVQDYENFSYDEQSLTLDEAIKKARDLRRNDSHNFYRVKQANENGFTVKKVSMSSVYADFIAKMARLASRFSVLSTRR